MAGSILGVDHICAGTAQLTDAAASLERLGFSVLFRQDALPVPPEKRPFMRAGAPACDMIFLKAPAALSIELLRHHAAAPTAVGYGVVIAPQPSGEVIERRSPASAWPARLEPILGDVTAGYALGPALPFLASTSANPSGAGVALVGLQTHNLEASVAFWTEGLGFSAGTRRARVDVRRLALRALRPNWSVELLLVEKTDAQPARAFIDDEGWTCLSMLVRDLGGMLARLPSAGATEVGEPFALTVNGRPLRVAFLRGPAGELVELIELASS